MARIFISYRRDDSAGHVGWLRHMLSQRYGEEDVFRDIDTIAPGTDFVEAIKNAVVSCKVILVVIGPHWLDVKDRKGKRRLDDPLDFVRLEVAIALERNITIIPILVQGARMPGVDNLPEDIALLSRRNALELRDSSWEYDVQRLISVLDPTLSPKSVADTADTEQEGRRSFFSTVRLLVAALVLAPLISLAVYWYSATAGPKTADTAPSADTSVLPIATAVDETTGPMPIQASAQATTTVVPDVEQIVQANALIKEGDAFYAQQDLEQALDRYNRAIKLDPSARNAYNNRGNVYYQKREYDKAITNYTRAIELNSTEAQTYVNRGMTYKLVGEHGKAVTDYTRAIELDPNNAFHYFNRGESYTALTEFDEALTDYNRAIELDPSYSRSYNDRGEVYRLRGEYANALADYDRAIELDPNNPYPYNNRGNVYYHLQQYDKAVPEYTRALEIDPSFVQPYNNRGLMYYYLGEYEKALADFNYGISLNQSYGLTYYNRGLLYEQKADQQAAQADFQRAYQLGYAPARDKLVKP